ncbi:DUF1552 domain-containing protein [soil metagenome]
MKTDCTMTRRHFLRASGVALCLPMLESVGAGAAVPPKRRLMAVGLGLGLHAPNLVPVGAGRGYALTPYLESLKEVRDDFTVISGTSHPEVDGGHAADKSYLTAAPHPGSASFRNSQSIDQLAAREIGLATRYSYLPLSDYGNSLSVSRSGVPVPGQNSPSRIFEKLFLEGQPAEKEQQIARLKEGQSVLDMVMDKARRMRRRVSKRDHEKLDEYLTAVRETEQRLVKAEAWEHHPKPAVDYQQPRDVSGYHDVIGRARLMYDMAQLAIQTDSTRLITYAIGGPNEAPSIPGISEGYHNLSHHGMDPGKIAQLTLVESAHFDALAGFLSRLKAIEEGDSNLLDRTMILYGSHLGNASSHNNTNMPILLAGGGFRHGQHLAFDPENNYPLPNLFVSMLQRLGLEIDRFASSTGTMRGLEMA